MQSKTKKQPGSGLRPDRMASAAPAWPDWSRLAGSAFSGLCRAWTGWVAVCLTATLALSQGGCAAKRGRKDHLGHSGGARQAGSCAAGGCCRDAATRKAGGRWGKVFSGQFQFSRTSRKWTCQNLKWPEKTLKKNLLQDLTIIGTSA